MNVRKMLFSLVVMVFIGHAITAQALNKFSTGFYWPLDNFTYSSAGTWLGPGLGNAGPHGHIGVDMLAPAGTSVYAISDGIVLLISLNGWGDNNVAVLVKHQLYDGRYFIALYGHIMKSSALKKGTKVYAGKTVIGKLGPYFTSPHLHLGVVPPNTSYGPTFGYATASNHNGFVDPIRFLQTHYPKNKGYRFISEQDAYGNTVSVAWAPANVPCDKASVWSYNQTCSAEYNNSGTCQLAYDELKNIDFWKYNRDDWNTIFFGSISDFQNLCY